jgi:hypothetical protein
LGEPRFLETVGDGFDQPASSTLDELLSDLKGYFRDGNCPDDMTVMIIHRD